MNDLAIRARKISKSYRLYDNPGDRLLDLLGFLPGARRKVREHRALSDVSFDIHRGEKVAIIGRNGAGKSTLLKMITRVTEPSSGSLEVRGESRALLQIGTGFHPDFTGRDNVAAYLASLGVSERDAEPLIADAIAFAELEDFADQPVKTYSTGMGMRLMFAASTMMKPELLVVDEVLGVGDSYFQRKSFERIRELCDGRGTTLLLVTHDVYSAASLCDRMIWIDRGRVLIDAEPATVTRAYEDSVREQEERRLRQKALAAARQRGERARKERVVVEVQVKDNQAPPAPVWFSRLTLLIDGAQIASLPFGEDAFDARDGGRLQREGANWGDPAFVEGRLARPLKTHGSAFHKVAGVFEFDAIDGGEGRALALLAEYRMEAPVALQAMLTTSDRRVVLGLLPVAVDEWTSQTVGQGAGAGEQHAPASAAETIELTNWHDWIVASPDFSPQIDQLTLTLTLRWGGAAGPYLMMTPPIMHRHEGTAHLPLDARVRSGRLGLGALDADGQWLQTWEFSEPHTHCDLQCPTGADGALRLVLYSAVAEPLLANVSFAAQEHGAAEASVNTSGIYGAGDIRMESFQILDETGAPALVLPVNRPARFRFGYRIYRHDLCEQAQVLIAFRREGIEDVFRSITRRLHFNAAEADTGVISADFDPFPLAPGRYTVTVMITAPGYFDERQATYFSMNPLVYFAQSVAAEITVSGWHQLYEAANVVGDGAWTIESNVQLKQAVAS